MPTKYCPVCGSQQAPYARFCDQCGGAFFENNLNPETYPHASLPLVDNRSFIQKYRGWLIAGFISFIALLGLAETAKRNLVSRSLQTPPVASSLPTVPSTYISTETTAGFEIKGKVVGVSDGDTIVVLDADRQEHKIRLAGIDAPESGQDFGNKAKQNLSSLVYGKTVTVIGDKVDKYGRQVAKVIVDGKDINLEQVKSGFAWHYKKYESEQSETDRKLYAAAETSARLNKSSLWSMANPIAPWEFRETGGINAELKDKIFGNKNSMLYHWAGCPGFAKISQRNRVVFETWQDAEAAGYTAVTNCKNPKPEKDAADDAPDLDDLEAVTSDRPVSSPYVYIKPKPTVDIYDGRTATATCNDGSYSYAKDLRQACVGNNGVDRWLYSSAAETQSTPYPTYRTPEYKSPPTYSSPSIPSATATAVCSDGTLSYSSNHQGTCSHHGGVARWLDGSSSYSTPSYSSPTYSTGSGTVNVSGYYRKDGTYVRPHTRRSPRR